MNMTEAVRSGFDHFTDWKGRASRPAYWWLVLASLLAVYIPLILGAAIGGAFGAFLLIVGGIAWLAFILPTLSTMVRRLHDTGRSGWWYWISLVPLIGGIWLLVLLIIEGDAGDNKYGPNPGSGVSEPGAAAPQAPPAA